LANGLSATAFSLVLSILALNFFMFVSCFAPYDILEIGTARGYYLVPRLETAIAKMLLQFEDTDLTDIGLFISNTSLHLTSILVCMGVTVHCFLESSQSMEFRFYLACFVWVEVGVLVGILIEYCLVKAVVLEALKERIDGLKERNERDFQRGDKSFIRLLEVEVNWKNVSICFYPLVYSKSVK